MTGIGIIIIVAQFDPILGRETPAGGTLEKLSLPPTMLSSEINTTAVTMFSVVLAILLLIPARLARLLPPPLFVLLAVKG